MDDRTDDTTPVSTTTKALAVVAVAAVLGLGARELFGDAGVTAVLVLALVAVAALAYRELGGPVPARLTRTAPERPEEPEVLWRSERWFAETVERGLRALDVWRLDQDPHAL